jgi:hypothetical protein
MCLCYLLVALRATNPQCHSGYLVHAKPATQDIRCLALVRFGVGLWPTLTVRRPPFSLQWLLHGSRLWTYSLIVLFGIRFRAFPASQPSSIFVVSSHGPRRRYAYRASRESPYGWDSMAWRPSSSWCLAARLVPYCLHPLGHLESRHTNCGCRGWHLHLFTIFQCSFNHLVVFSPTLPVSHPCLSGSSRHMIACPRYDFAKRWVPSLAPSFVF